MWPIRLLNVRQNQRFLIEHNLYCSNISDRSYLRLNELDFTHLPLDVSSSVTLYCLLRNQLQIIFQALISLFVIMYGVMHVAGDFKEIKASADLENKSWETFRNIPSFYIFNHRGRFLSINHSNQTQDLDYD